MQVIYICYFSLEENLVQTQVVSYLCQLAGYGYKITLITFEKNAQFNVRKLSYKAKLDEYGINWRFLKYHKKPSVIATMYDVLVGILKVISIARKHKVTLLHARSHVPLLIAIISKFFINATVLFDIRGLLADEYADAGVLRTNSPGYLVLKTAEWIGINHSDWLVVLTEKLKTYIVNKYPNKLSRITVIPCCTDTVNIANLNNHENNSTEQLKCSNFEMIYSGSVSGLYLMTEVARFFSIARKLIPNVTLTILTNESGHNYVKSKLSTFGIKPDIYRVIEVPPSEVYNYLTKARFGLSFRKPTFSQIAASPTKIPEYLSAGLPVISNHGIGDTDHILSFYKVGVILNGFNDEDFRIATYNMLALLKDSDLKARCKRVATQLFDLKNVGGARYAQTYHQLERLKSC